MRKELKEKVLEANLQLPKYGMVTFTWGNVSEIDRKEGIIAIKPSGVDYDKMKAEDIVILDLEGKVVEGKLRPSSDAPTHVILYKEFPEVGGIVHTHSRYATSWAQAECDIPCYGTTQADYFYGAIPCARKLTPEEIDGAYELNTGLVIIETFRERGVSPVEIPGVLCAKHGPFAWGKDAFEAVHNAVVMEEVAMMALNARLVNPSIEPAPQSLLDKHYLRKHGKNAYYGQK